MNVEIGFVIHSKSVLSEIDDITGLETRQLRLPLVQGEVHISLALSKRSAVDDRRLRCEDSRLPLTLQTNLA